MRMDRTEILQKLTNYCGKSVYNYTENETDPLKWDFYNSFYFAYTVVSTIGYGNLVPTTMSSKILMILYALLGIPMNGILLSQLGDFFSVIFIRAHEKYKSYKENHRDEFTKKLAPLETRKAGLAARVLMYLAPGFVMFIFFPASVISYYEETTYNEAVYYAFVTLTTIGFGDIVAGQDNTRSRCQGPFYIFYKAFLIVWIVFGLGYMVMIITFITRGMRSKQITRLEHKLAMNLKQTQTKIWGEFNKEVSYLRRVFNELQLSRVKRVYVNKFDYKAPLCKSSRSKSFPDLRELIYGGLTLLVPSHPRRRANSEVVPTINPVRARVVSETDLQRIDKAATFATHAIVQPAELLARLVNILGYIPPSSIDDEPPLDNSLPGLQGFSNKEILSNEFNNNWKVGSDQLSFRKPRSRATSEVHLKPKYDRGTCENHEWTWSGPAASRKIDEIIRRRQNGNKESKDSKSLFPAFNIPKSVSLSKWIKHLSSNKKESRTRNSVSVGDLEHGDENYLSTINNVNERSTYFTHTGANLSCSLENSNLLEETSVADFLRAMTALHTQVGVVPSDYVKKPQRKMGTASLTPPKLPSLLSLFSPPTDFSTSIDDKHVDKSFNYERKFSSKIVEEPRNLTTCGRLNSIIHTNKMKNRRFSLRPVETTSERIPQVLPYLSDYRYDGKNPTSTFITGFSFESSKKPLVNEESIPGISSPIVTSSGPRFSLRPEQFVGQAPSNIIGSKGIQKWRAGMLRKQISQNNLQKRVRASSLSDISIEGLQSSERNLGISPLATNDHVRTFEISKDNKSLKTVTIVSPKNLTSDLSINIESQKNYISDGAENIISTPNDFGLLKERKSITDMPKLRKEFQSDTRSSESHSEMNTYK
ncbi:open rectifier potassium channel protein 1-like isoform X2 [Aphidius gifuensis]|nr:open rectifier potassium channel protein 1-like isoform X2 [Aphidius gifuensis]